MAHSRKHEPCCAGNFEFFYKNSPRKINCIFELPMFKLLIKKAGKNNVKPVFLEKEGSGHIVQRKCSTLSVAPAVDTADFYIVEKK